MDKKYILLAVVGLVLIYFILKSKQKAAPLEVDETASAIAASGKSVTAQQQEAISNVAMSGVDEEYNQAREEYRQAAGKYPPASWTIGMINDWIDEQKQKNNAIKQYIGLISEMDGAEKQDTADMTLSQIEALIDETTKTKQKQEAAKKKAEQTAKVTNLVDRFVATLQSPNYFLITAKKKNVWDTSTLNAMLQLSDAEKAEFNSIFAKRGVKTPDYFNQERKRWVVRKSVSSAIVKGNANTSRGGYEIANKVKNAFANV